MHPFRFYLLAGFFLLLLIILTIVVILHPKRPNYQLQGYIEGQFRYLSSSQSGLLKKLYVDRGYPIKAGQILFELDPDPEKAQLDQAKFQLDSAQQNFTNKPGAS
jgi:HlyD family secretion protein